MRSALVLVLFVTTVVPAGAQLLESAEIASIAQGRPAGAAPIFTFHNAFWPNLHHFLYVLGRARIGTSDAARRAVVDASRDDLEGVATLSDEENKRWEAAVWFYRQGLSKQDAVFDSGLIDVTRALADAGDRPTLQDRRLGDPLVRMLEQVAPVYRKAWWPRHRAANEARIAEVSTLLRSHGAQVRDRMTRAYGLPWPSEGRTMEMCAYANWAGAYSTHENVIVMSGLDPGSAGSLGLETLFHEASHQWGKEIGLMLADEAKRQGKTVPGALSHAMIFYTAGHTTRQEIPVHKAYAEVNGMWVRGQFAPFKDALDRAWQPWLDGTGTLAAAVEALIRAI